MTNYTLGAAAGAGAAGGAAVAAAPGVGVLPEAAEG